MALSDEQIDLAIQQHIDPVATYRKLHDFARAAEAATVATCIARLEQGGQSAAVSILRHHFEQKGG